MDIARKKTRCFEGMKILRAKENGIKFVLQYVTISNDYELKPVGLLIEELTGYLIEWQELDYDFETSAKIIFS